MQCNWLAIVRGDGGLRACVFCGQHKREHCKIVTVASVEKLLAAQCDAWQNDIFARTLQNICKSARHSHEFCNMDETEANFSACLCCHHWVARRKKNNIIFPLQALSWYVNTLRPVQGKNMDHRVVLRLCQALSAQGPLPFNINMQDSTQSKQESSSRLACLNHYRCLFNSTQKKLLDQVASNSIQSIGWRLAKFYHKQNAFTIFLPNSSLVEKIRKSTSALHDDM